MRLFTSTANSVALHVMACHRFLRKRSEKKRQLSPDEKADTKLRPKKSPSCYKDEMWATVTRKTQMKNLEAVQTCWLDRYNENGQSGYLRSVRAQTLWIVYQTGQIEPPDQISRLPLVTLPTIGRSNRISSRLWKDFKIRCVLEFVSAGKPLSQKEVFS